MSQPRPAPPVLLVIGLLRDPELPLEPVAEAIGAAFGPIADLSAPLAFEHTAYYEPEMGPGLLRQFAALAELVDPGRLADIKWQTNEIESKFSREDGRRRINLDPGLLGFANLVLATGKGYTHRPYLGNGIYADLTLIWQHGAWVELPWTYPDYRSEPVKAILTGYREFYREKAGPARSREAET
ncbi:MAG: DUF4416 family protein [Myxococcales bacterium]|nr:DUF4416 family protein [Myxococcales bacterium]